MEEVYSLGPQQNSRKQVNVNCSYFVQFFSRGNIKKDIKLKYQNSHPAPSLYSLKSY